MEGVKSFSFSKYEMVKAAKVFGWSLASAVVTLLIALAAAAEVPAEYALLIPVINTVLYAVKELIADNRGKKN